jgi:hypothetical protein
MQLEGFLDKETQVIDAHHCMHGTTKPYLQLVQVCGHAFEAGAQ